MPPLIAERPAQRKRGPVRRRSSHFARLTSTAARTGRRRSGSDGQKAQRPAVAMHGHVLVHRAAGSPVTRQPVHVIATSAGGRMVVGQRTVGQRYCAPDHLLPRVLPRRTIRPLRSVPSKNEKVPLCGAFVSAPRETRTPTGHTSHKALNLARLPIPPQARAGCAV